jgi:hypothetical protein
MLAGSPPTALSQPPSVQMGRPSAQLRELWTAGEPMSAVYAFLGRHAPTGMRWNGGGQSSSYGAITEEFVGYQLSRLPAGVNAAVLSMSVAPDGHDASVIRADAQVIWYPPRSAAEYIPASVHAVTITAWTLGHQGGVTSTFTAPSVLQRLTAMLNGAYALPQGSVFSCPLDVATYRLAFATAPGAAPSLVMTDTGCPGIQVTAGGRAQPTLEIPPGLQPLLDGLTHLATGDLTHNPVPGPATRTAGQAGSAPIPDIAPTPPGVHVVQAQTKPTNLWSGPVPAG